MDKDFLAIFNAIKADGANADYTKRGIEPLYSVGAGARIVVIGQAPGAVAEETRIPWNDKSGERLRDWLGVSRETFYDPERVALLPMDFYFPGHGRSGDLPPRKGIRRAVASCTLGAHAQCSAHCALWAHMPSAGTCISRIRTALQPWCAIMMPISAGDSSLWCIRRRATSYG
mgnify:CR=1 FL=1